jgi:hypothetical protein
VIVSTQDGGDEFRFLLAEERQQDVGQAFDVPDNEYGRLPAQRYTASRHVYEH